MHFTVFDTPIIRPILRFVSIVGLKLAGWKMENRFPLEKKYVLIAAPHTTNWDFPLTLAFCFASQARIYWMGKASLFKGPAGPVMRWLGGISVDRSKKNSLVDQMVEAYRAADSLVVTIPPEGTRKAVKEWKTGFYYIAHGAGVPIALAYLDYPSRTCGFGPMFTPTGDIETDMREIKAFYHDKRGKY